MKTPLFSFYLFLMALCLSGQALAQGATMSNTLGPTQNVQVGQLVEFTVSTTRGNVPPNTMVRGLTVLLGENVAARRQLVQLEYFDDQTEEWNSLTMNEAGVAVFGPEAGFALADQEAKFRARFNQEGVYSFRMEVVTVAGGVTLASTEATVTVIPFMEPVINSTLDIVSSQSGIRTNEDAWFQVIVDANERAGELVNIRLTFADEAQRDNFMIKYVAAGTTLDDAQFAQLREGADGALYYGDEAGFALADLDKIFIINFSEPGTYTYTFDLLRVTDNVVTASTTETVEVLAGATVASTLNNKAGVMKDVETDFAVTTTVGTWPAGTNVRYKISFAPAQAANVSLMLGEGTAFTALPVDANGVAYIGSADPGFPFTAATTNLKATFDAAGTYEYMVEVINLATDQVIARSTESVLVGSAETVINSTLNSRANVIRNATTDFVVTTIRGAVAENTPVRIRITLAAPAQSANITLMREKTAGTFEAVTFTDGVAFVGAPTGFMLVDGTTNMRIAFDTPGTYNYTLDLVQVEGGRLLATSAESVVVQNVASIKNSIANELIKVYPTVSNGTVSVELGKLRNAQVVVQDALGRIVSSVSNANGTAHIQTRNFAKGTYYVKVVSGKETATSRFIVR